MLTLCSIDRHKHMDVLKEPQQHYFILSVIVKHLFAWPYFHEAINKNIFMRLYFHDLSNLVLLSFHLKSLARTLILYLLALANLCQNKVLAIKSVLQYLKMSISQTTILVHTLYIKHKRCISAMCTSRTQSKMKYPVPATKLTLDFMLSSTCFKRLLSPLSLVISRRFAELISESDSLSSVSSGPMSMSSSPRSSHCKRRFLQNTIVIVIRVFWKKHYWLDSLCASELQFWFQTSNFGVSCSLIAWVSLSGSYLQMHVYEKGEGCWRTSVYYKLLFIWGI